MEIKKKVLYFTPTMLSLVLLTVKTSTAMTIVCPQILAVKPNFITHGASGDENWVAVSSRMSLDSPIWFDKVDTRYDD